MPTNVVTGAAHAVLSELMGQLRAALSDPPSPGRCRELARDLTEIAEMGMWCREATLELARLTHPPLTWRQIQTATGVSDATLYDRHRRWKEELA